MQEFVHFLNETFISHTAAQAIIVLAFVCGIGLLLSKIPMGNFSLGVTWVFFTGILAAHFGLSIDPMMNSFCQSFGLVFFLYALGVQVGPSFFPSLKSGGIKENLLSMVVILLGLALCVIFKYTIGMPMTDLIGVLSGAVTNTPMLAAAQSSVVGIIGHNAEIESNMALATAVAYPFGVVGMIVGMMILSVMIKGKSTPKNNDDKAHAVTSFTEFEVANPAVFGKTIADVAKRIDHHFVVSRIWQQGKVHIPNSKTELHQGDRILVASHDDCLPALEVVIGKRVDKDWNNENIDWDAIDNELISKRLVITNRELNGRTLGDLKLRSIYGVNVTRIDRSGIELFASPQLHLQLGDRMSIVGDVASVNACEQLIGNEVKMLDAPNMLSLFIGVFLGCLLGSVPFLLPGISMPIKLGLGGGPIIVGILVGAFGARLKMTTYITNSASQLIQKLGLMLFLAALGLSSGAKFFETLLHGDGLLWLGVGAVITVLPVVITGWMAMRFFKMRYSSTCGMLCGSMANPMALEYLVGKVDDDSHNVSYATVYPLSMFVRIITAQIMIIVFLA